MAAVNEQKIHATLSRERFMTFFFSLFFYYYGRAKRGDSTAEDGRKQERSSAPYAVAYSPRGSENILGNIWDISGSNENRPLIIRLGDFRPMPALVH